MRFRAHCHRLTALLIFSFLFYTLAASLIDLNGHAKVHFVSLDPSGINLHFPPPMQQSAPFLRDALQ